MIISKNILIIIVSLMGIIVNLFYDFPFGKLSLTEIFFPFNDKIEDDLVPNKKEKVKSKFSNKITGVVNKKIGGTIKEDIELKIKNLQKNVDQNTELINKASEMLFKALDQFHLDLVDTRTDIGELRMDYPKSLIKGELRQLRKINKDNIEEVDRIIELLDKMVKKIHKLASHSEDSVTILGSIKKVIEYLEMARGIAEHLNENPFVNIKNQLTKLFIDISELAIVSEKIVGLQEMIMELDFGLNEVIEQKKQIDTHNIKRSNGIDILNKMTNLNNQIDLVIQAL